MGTKIINKEYMTGSASGSSFGGPGFTSGFTYASGYGSASGYGRKD